MEWQGAKRSPVASGLVTGRFEKQNLSMAAMGIDSIGRAD
jgi:hypothetical protein